MKAERIILILSTVTLCWGIPVIKRVTGSSVTFKAELSGHHTEINWFRDTSRIVDLEEGKPPDFYILGDRAIADLRNATLTLMSLTPADSGKYKAELLVGGNLSPVFFNLQVFDHVCHVIIRNTTAGNNMTLRCECSDHGSPAPSRYQWYNGSKVVSDKPEITVEKQIEEQKYHCNASNEVSSKEATIKLPALSPEHRTHPAAIIIPILIGLLIAIAVCYKYKERLLSYLPCRNSMKVATDPNNQTTNGHYNRVPDPDAKKEDVSENRAPDPDAKKEDAPENRGEQSGETVPLLTDVQQNGIPAPDAEKKDPENKSPCCCLNLKLPFKKDREICITKDKKLLMKIQYKELLDLKRCRVQRGRLTIKDVVDGDYGVYTAEVQLSTGGEPTTPTTYRFQACKPAQNQEDGACNDESVTKPAQNREDGACNDESVIKLASPLGGVLNLEIPDVENIKTIIWGKGETVLLMVTCDPDPLLETLELCEGTLRIQPVSGDDDGRYQVADGDASDRCINLEMNIRVTLDPGKEKKKTVILIEILEYFHPAEVNASDLASITFYPEIKEKAEIITWKKDGENVAQCKEQAETNPGKKDGENVAQCKEQAETNLGKKDGENVAQLEKKAETIPGKKDGENVAQLEKKAKIITWKKIGENVAQCKEQADTIPGKKDGENVEQLEEKAETIPGKKDVENVAQWKEKDPIPKNCPLDPQSGNLTISNLKEEDQGRYIMEAQSGDQTTVHEFILSYSIKGLTKKL